MDLGKRLQRWVSLLQSYYGGPGMSSKQFLYWWYLLCLGSAYPDFYLMLYRTVSISILVVGSIELFGTTEGAVEVKEMKPTKVPGLLQTVGNNFKT